MRSGIALVVGTLVCASMCALIISYKSVRDSVFAWESNVLKAAIDACPNNSQHVLVLGMPASALGNAFERHMHAMQDDMERALAAAESSSPGFVVVDALGAPEEELLRARTCASHVMLNFMVLRLVCAQDAPSYTNVLGTLAFSREHVRERARFLRHFVRNATRNPTVVGGGWLNDIHPYSWGPGGHVGAARCFADMGVTRLLASYFFTPDMLALSGAIASLSNGKSAVRIYFMPFHARELALPPPPPPGERYDVLLMGSTLRQVYPFRHRLAQLMVNFSRVVCSGGVGTDFRPPSSAPIRLGPCASEHMRALAQRCRVGVSTAQGHSAYSVFKYTELPMMGLAVVGNLPLDARIALFPDGAGAIPLRESDTDAAILQSIRAALSAPTFAAQRERAHAHVCATVGLSRYAAHVRDVMFEEEQGRAFHPIPPFLRGAYERVLNGLTYLDMLEMDTWDGLVAQILRLGNKTPVS